MSLTSRGKITIGVVAGTLVLAGVGATLAFTGNAPGPLQRIFDRAIRQPDPCPLTGRPPRKGKEVPDRPLLAVKIENSPDARPQAGLEKADVVFEEPVEGGLTRFIVLYHCTEAKRLGPVRSARTTDPDALAQFGWPLFAYAGANDQVQALIARSDLVDLSYLVVDAYVRDPSRSAPHNLYSSTRALWRAGRGDGEPPAEVFGFSDDLDLRGKRARTAHLPFSYASDVYWSWDSRSDGWLRSHGTTPHVMESGERVRADTVVVMHVRVTLGGNRDAAGNPSPVVTLTGTGRVWVLRDGRVIAGRWERPKLSDATRFVTKSGELIALHPGVTWVELLPTEIDPEFTARG